MLARLSSVGLRCDNGEAGKGERLSPLNLAELYIKVIQNLLKMSEDNALRVIDLSKTIIEYIWETELCKCEQLSIVEMNY